MPLDEVFALSPVASFQSVGDGAVVLLADSGQLYSCNDTSEAFLRHVDGKRSLSEIIDLLAEEYEAERGVLEADFAELAESLKQEGVIVSGK
jgi:pyrroloquinoline quinone biosynthesis protein D